MREADIEELRKSVSIVEATLEHEWARQWTPGLALSIADTVKLARERLAQLDAENGVR